MDLGWYNIVATCLTLLLSGTNIASLLNNRQLRRKLAAEAVSAEYESQKLIIEGLSNEVTRLQERLSVAERRYDELLEKYASQTDSIVEMKEEIANLKSKSK